MSEILAQASQELRDPGMNKVGAPFYESAAQTALTELNYSAPFFKKEYRGPITNGVVDLPCDLTATDSVFLYNGDYNAGTASFLYTSPITTGWNDSSPWQNELYGYVQPPSGCNLYAGIRNGKLYLSSFCSNFGNVFIAYTGIGMDSFGCDFVVPMWARRAIVDKVVLAVAITMEQDNLPYYRGVIARKESATSPGNPNGSWCAAIGIWNRMDPKEYSDVMVQTQRIGHSFAGTGYAW